MRSAKDYAASFEPGGAERTLRTRTLNAYGRALLDRMLADRGRSYMPAAHAAGHPDGFRETVDGGHALVIEYGDCEFYAHCQCGEQLGMCDPARLGRGGERFLRAWEKHTTEAAR